MKASLIPGFLKESPNFHRWQEALTPPEMHVALKQGGLRYYHKTFDHSTSLYFRSYNLVGYALYEGLKSFGIETGGHSLATSGAWLLSTPEKVRNDVWVNSSVHLIMPNKALRYEGSNAFSLTDEGVEWRNRLEAAICGIVEYQVKVTGFWV